jgi:cyclopropane fatty-acyl-phospholipid synthase-like methyltransferase
MASLRWKVKYAKRRLIVRFLPRYAHRTKVERWDRSWAAPDFAPGWAGGPVPTELEEAVRTGWFEPGGTALDIGCGDGRLARWLAERGYIVHGVDFAAAAIAKASAQHADVERTSFETLDVCLQPVGQNRFDALLDRGTFQSVEARLRDAYARNIAAAAKPGARFLLLHVTSMRKDGYRDDDLQKEKTSRRVTRLFGPTFELERTTDAVLGETQDGQPFARGLAFWMVRR